MKVELRKGDEGPVVVVEGDVDHANVEQLVAAFQQLTDEEAPTIRLDFGNVTYVDSAGLSAIYDLAAKARGRIIEIRDVSPFLWRIFEVAGLTVDERLTLALNPAMPADAPGPAMHRPIHRHGPLSKSRTFPSHLDQLPLVRQFVEEVAADAVLDDRRTFDLKVAVSEAAANAIEHGLGEGDLEISAKRRRGRLTVGVAHPGAFRARTGDDPERAHRGMGLPLMLALTNEVTVSCPNGGGTNVSLSVFLD